jgi:glycerol-3-phosphate cytidylyltransferase
MKKVITFGTFDLLHDGHLRILERARSLGDYLVVGVSTDHLNAQKGKRSFFDQKHRMECVAALKVVDEVFFEDSLERKDQYIREHGADLLVMGDDWRGKFDWVSCEVVYLPRTPGISSTEVKLELGGRFKCKRVLFGDTYIRKHYDCALSLVNELTAANIAPIFSTGQTLPSGVDCDCLVYFNLPVSAPAGEYASKPRVLVDHGASHLKWFLSNPARFDFFDVIVTAGPDHTNALLTFFSDIGGSYGKVRSAGFIKSGQLLQPPSLSREQIALKYALDPARPIILFAPTWHISNNPDMAAAILEIAKIENHVALLHPETAHLDVSRLNVAPNESGVVSELLKHADCVVSDLSSTIYEAAALGRPVVQLLLREYSDNNAVVYDFPYAAGTAELFCGGLPTRPDGVARAVDRVLAGDEHVAVALQRMRNRIMRGTRIEAGSVKAVATEIARACDMAQERSLPELRAQRKTESSYSAAHQNLFFSRNRLIAQKGGRFKGVNESSSREAIECALAAVDWVELDFSRCADGVVVAQSGTESKYGFEQAFISTSTEQFLRSRFEGGLTPIAVENAIELCARKGRALVCGISSDRDYEFIISHLASMSRSAGLINQVVVKCYSVENFNAALRAGFSRAILSVENRYANDPLGSEAFDFIDTCLMINSHCVVGIDIPYKNPSMALSCLDDPRTIGLYATWKRVYVHGAPPKEYGRILNQNFGVFAHGYSAVHDFSNKPRNFHWPTYLFLHPDVAKAGLANQVGATLHYLIYGAKEGRATRYSAPADFLHGTYLDLNPGLRDAGISGEHSAKAHWTKYGAMENRRYRR